MSSKEKAIISTTTSDWLLRSSHCVINSRHYHNSSMALMLPEQNGILSLKEREDNIDIFVFKRR